SRLVMRINRQSLARAEFLCLNSCHGRSAEAHRAGDARRPRRQAARRVDLVLGLLTQLESAVLARNVIPNERQPHFGIWLGFSKNTGVDCQISACHAWSTPRPGGPGVRGTGETVSRV